MSEETKLDLAPIKAKAEKAHKMVVDLCKRRGESGSREWIMSIPARPDYDPDLVIDASLSDVPALVAEVERLREERDDQASLVEVFEDEAKRLRSDLAECYRITGADPDGDDDAMLATKAVAAVKRLREESDREAEAADKRIAELEIGVREIAIMHQDDRPGIGEPSGDFDWRLRSEAQERVARALLAKGGAA